MNGEGLKLGSVLAVAGLGLLAYVVLFRKSDVAGSPTLSSLNSLPPSPVAAGASAPASGAAPQAATRPEPQPQPVASGVSHIIARDIRALVAPQTMLMHGEISATETTPPYMTPQEGSGAVRIFSPGEEIFINEFDAKDGCFYAAETMDAPQGKILTGYKRYYAGSPDILMASISGTASKTPDYDPYTGQAFSAKGRAIAAALADGKKILVSGNMEDFRDAPMRGHRYDDVPYYGSTRLPPRAARQMRMR